MADPRIRTNNDGGNGQGGFQAVTPMGDALVAQSLPPYAELSRRNKGWQVMNTSAVAALIVRPSTTAHGTLYNNNSVASKVAFVIDRIFAFNLVGTAALSGWSIWACVHPTGRAADTADITAIKSMSGLSTAYGGGAIFDNGATVTDDGWFPVNDFKINGGVTTASSGALIADIGGRFIIPPTAALSIAPVATIVGLTMTVGVSWWEIPMLMGDAS